MKKHLIGMIALSSSLFMGAYLLAQPYAIQAQTLETENNGIEVASIEYQNEVSSMNQLINALFEEEVSIHEYEEIETEHFGFKSYQLDNLTLETDIHLNQMGKQEGTVLIYEKGCSSISNDLQLTLDLNQPIKNFVSNTKYSFQVTFEQVDKTAPVIRLKDDAITLNYNASFKADKYVKSVVDGVDGKVSYTVDNPVQTRKPGTYTVTYSATDKAGNKATKQLKVTVKKKPTYGRENVSANTNGNIFTMLKLINETRASYGLAPYTLDTHALGAAAQLRAYESMAYLHQVPLHVRPNGSSYTTALTEMGTSASNAVEILTYGGSTPQAGLNWWMNSSVHRSYILSRNHTKIGIGFSNGMWCGIVK